MKQCILIGIFYIIGSCLWAQDLTCFTQDQRENTLEGIWIGEFIQNSCGIHEALAMSLEIQELRDSVVQGLFIWENLEDRRIVQTSLEGYYFDEKMALYETSLVTGEGVVMNGVYEIPLEHCRRLEGIWRVDVLQVECDDPQTLTEGGRFVLHKINKGSALPQGVSIKAPLVIPTEFLTLHVQRIDANPTGNLQFYRNDELLLDNILSERPHKLIMPLDTASQVFSVQVKGALGGRQAKIKLELYSQGQKLTEFELMTQGKIREGIRIRRP